MHHWLRAELEQLGFRSFGFRELDSTIGQQELIWGDDFTFAITPPPVSGCSGDVVFVSNTTVPSGITECIATTSITVGPNVLVVNGAELWLYAPEVRIGNGVTVELGATFHAGSIP